MERPLDRPLEHRDQLLETMQAMRIAFTAAHVTACPFYEALCAEMIADVERDGPVATLLAPHALAPFDAVYTLRLLGGVHRMVLAGTAPELAAHFPSTGGDGDAAAAMAVMRELLADPPPEVVDALTRPPQTNEVGRSIALMSGLLVVADELGLPLRLREIGSSGGLNLRPESYWYTQDGAGWGDATSPVRFVDLWTGGAPPFDASVEIVDRRGCDRDPIDITTDDGALTLLSYCWPEPPERFARSRDAIALAHDLPVVIDRADARSWVAAQLAAPHPDTAMVLYHSVMWQYLDDATQEAITNAIEIAGRVASADAPVAWLRLEPNPTTYAPAELRVTIWDGGSGPGVERLLATTSFHGGEILWNPPGTAVG
jgi:hypothetical protein